MTTKIKMGHVFPRVHGILFADPNLAVRWREQHPVYARHVDEWRVTMGLKLLATGSAIAPQGMMSLTWVWPMVPMIGYSADTWLTGTVADMPLNRAPIEPEVNRRLPRLANDGTEIPRVSRKVAHRVLWCDRNRGVIVTDPLYREAFTDLEEALAFIEEKRKIRATYECRQP